MKHSKLIRQILSVVLTLSFCVPIEAFATTNSVTQQDVEEINKANASKYALSFAEAICGETNFDSSEVVSFLGEDDGLAGFCVDLKKNGAPNGYVVIKFSNNEPVVSEFCFEVGAENPYKEIVNHYDIADTSNIFYSIGSNEYYVYAEEKNAFFGLNNEKISTTEFEEMKSEVSEYKTSSSLLETSSIQNINNIEKQITYSSVGNSDVISDSFTGSVKEQVRISGAGTIYYEDDDVYNNGLKYACGVVAVCNMMKFLRTKGFTKISSNFPTLYNKLWEETGTITLNDENGIHGTTEFGGAWGGAVTYLEELGYMASYDSYSLTLYSDFKRDLKNGYPCMLSYATQNIFKGHMVFVTGFTETSSYQYLCVVDGWNKYARFLNFNGFSYVRKNGGSLAAAL